MGKAKRKPKPSMPKWYWMDQDGCWYCKTEITAISVNQIGNIPKSMAERNSKADIQTKIGTKIKVCSCNQ